MLKAHPEIKDLFGHLARTGNTVFVSTHTLAVAEAIADRIGIIHHAHLIAVFFAKQCQRAHLPGLVYRHHFFGYLL